MALTSRGLRKEEPKRKASSTRSKLPPGKTWRDYMPSGPITLEMALAEPPEEALFPDVEHRRA